MKSLTLTLSAVMALSLAACQTTGSAKTANEMLFSGIDAGKISAEGPSAATLGAENPTCLKFYANTTRYITQPQPGKVAKNFGKTIALGMLAGAASGGVGSLGISSSFLELALAGAANQVVFQGGQTALDKVTGEADKLTPQEEIDDAAAKLGCPAPSKAAMKGAKKAAKAMKKKEKSEE